MKILWLYWSNPKRNDSNGRSRRIHYDFVTQLNKLRDVELVIYGPGQGEINELVPIKYHRKISMSFLKRMINPDVVLLYTIGNVLGWMPSGFKDSQIPKVMVECDWWQVGKKQRVWYKENNINFIIQRGSVNTNLNKMPSTWLPFSASDEFVKYQQIPLRKRDEVIGFVGRGGGEKVKYASVYQNRYKALQLLKQQKLVLIRGEVGHDKYPNEVGSFRCCFSDCGRLHSPPAKTFEIMASGTLLLTDSFNGYENLFGDKEICKFYNRNRTGLVDTARSIVNGKVDELQVIVDAAVAEINKKHLDKHRIVELEHIIRHYLKTSTVEKLWGM